MWLNLVNWISAQKHHSRESSALCSCTLPVSALWEKHISSDYGSTYSVSTLKCRQTNVSLHTNSFHFLSLMSHMITALAWSLLSCQLKPHQWGFELFCLCNVLLRLVSLTDEVGLFFHIRILNSQLMSCFVQHRVLAHAILNQATSLH